MGFQTARLFGKRSSFIERIQGKLKTKRLVKGLKEDERLIHMVIPQLIKQEHKVEEGLKYEEDVADDLNTDTDRTDILFRNIYLGEDREMHFLIVNEGVFHNYLLHIEKNINDWKDKHKEAKALEHIEYLRKEFNKQVYGDAKDRENYLRDEYQDFMKLIQAAEHGDQQSFMEQVKSFWKQENASYLDYFLIRKELKNQLKEAKKEKGSLMDIMKAMADVEQKTKELAKKGVVDDKDLNEITINLTKIRNDVEKFAHLFAHISKQAHLALKRIILLDFLVMSLARDLSTETQEFVQSILIPRESGEKITGIINKQVYNEMDKVIREYAQAVRIEVREVQKAMKAAA